MPAPDRSIAAEAAPTSTRFSPTFSPYARQFLDRMYKPAVDAIEGIPPAIAIDQTNPVPAQFSERDTTRV